MVSDAVNAPHLSLQVPAGADAPASVRKALDRLNGALGPARDVLALVLSELVTNSVRHSGAGPDDKIEVWVEAAPDRIRVGVSDPGAGFDPQTRPPGADDGGGWGLFVVDQLVSRWTVEQDDGVQVICEIDR
jgi:anti-sigma regulatory factor (Ser/Thr protein kinase)